MRAWLVLAMTAVSAAHAAPSAELVVTWAPGHPVAGLAAEARAAGAAAIDLTPPAPATRTELPALLARGIQAYDALRFDDAWTALEAARRVADETGARDASRAQLADLFVYRGLVRAQRGEPEAWDELVAAMAIDPTRAFDPARFPPQVIAQLERARGVVVAAPRFEVAVVAPPGCTVTVDGGAPAGALPRGAHWIAATCADRLPWGQRVDVAADTTLTARPAALAPPDDGELLVQARALGARAIAIVEPRGELAELRVIAADGRERVRRATTWSDAPAALRALLAPAPTRPWYASRWVWAAGAAIVAAAVLVPITAAIAGERTPSSGGVRFPGVSF